MTPLNPHTKLDGTKSPQKPHSFIYQSATELARLIRTGTATSLEVVEAHLNRIKLLNPNLHAIVLLWEKEALQEAAVCDAEFKQGNCEK